jgi:hypothetical protein
VTKRRIPLDVLLPVLQDTSLPSGEIARRFGYKVRWIGQLRAKYKITGPRGGDRKGAKRRARIQSQS